MARGAGPVVRDAKKAQTRRALVEHAVALFDEHGFEKTTVDDIVAAAGVSQRTFFRHFAAKEDVVFEGVPERLAELGELLADVPADRSGWAAIRDNMRSLTRQYTDEDPELTAVRIRLWMTEPLLYARWTEFSLAWERELTQFLIGRRAAAGTGDRAADRTGQRDDHGFDIEAEVAAAAVIAALRAAWRGEVLHGGRFDELVQQALSLLERGLADL